MNPQQLVFLVILAGTLALFISNRVRIDLAAMLTLLALNLTGILTPSQTLSGFTSEPAIIVAAVFVISAGLNSTGLTERIGTFIARAAGSRASRQSADPQSGAVHVRRFSARRRAAHDSHQSRQRVACGPVVAEQLVRARPEPRVRRRSEEQPHSGGAEQQQARQNGCVARKGSCLRYLGEGK